MKDAKGEYSKIVGTDEPINEEWLAKQTIEMSADDYDDYKEKSGQVKYNVFYLLTSLNVLIKSCMYTSPNYRLGKLCLPLS